MRRTNAALLVLLAAALASGVAMYAVGSGWNAWATTVHAIVGVAVVGLSPWKSAIGRRSLARRGPTEGTAGLALAVVVAVALVTGFAHRAGVRSAGPVLAMQLHVGAALVAVPLLAWHVIARPVRVRRVDLDRRAVLRGSAVLGGSALVALALPHAGGRSTRSLERGSFDPPAMPVTQWLDDGVPTVDGGAWRLAVGDRRWSLDELDAVAGHELEATLDCTGGWYASQRWAGVRVDRLLEASAVGDGGTVEVRSVTGYKRRFPRGDASALVLALRAGGEPLSAGHGFPARLVAPGRRGFWWVKWVDGITVDDRPWWWQPPFPLT